MNRQCGILIPLLSATLCTADLAMLGAKQARLSEAEAQLAVSESQAVQKLLFRLPGTEWRKVQPRKAASRLFFRKYGDQRSHHVVVKFVSVPQGLFHLTPEQHASAYFEQERRDAMRNLRERAGEGYAEAESTVAGRLFRTMAGRTTDPIIGTSVVDEILVIYFPDDFQRQRGFYVVNWMDFHPPHAAPTGHDDLDALLSTLQVSR